MLSAMPWEAYLVVLVIAAAFTLIYFDVVRPVVALLLAVVLFLIAGILTPEQALKGFSNPNIAVVILLVLLAAGLRKHVNLEPWFERLYANTKSYRGFVLKMSTLVAFLSAFINNTPVVALMTPYVSKWGEKQGISPSKLLIPLSFATIMGGMLTLIGTSTTLVLNGFITGVGLTGFKGTDLLLIGLVVLGAGILFLVIFGYKLLPNQEGALNEFERNKREYMVEACLTPDSPLANKSVLEGKLRNLKGVYLVEIIRGTRTISPVEPGEVIEPEDRLIFAGNTENIVDLIKAERGLSLPKQAGSIETDKLDVVEVVVSTNSSMLGKRIKDTNFRERYDAAIVAVHRNGERLSGKIGDIRIAPGDLLLLYAGPSFSNQIDVFRDLFVVSNVRELYPKSRKKNISLLAIVLLAAGLLLSKQISLFISLLVIFTIMSAMQTITLRDIKRELDISMVTILGFSLALGEALISSGGGELLSQAILWLTQPFGRIAVLAGLMVLTTVLTSFVTNVGAASVAFPLAYSISKTLGVDGDPFYLAIAFSASAAFLTPIGYQTNLIVYGPGGYTFKDFFKIGLPMTVVYLSATLAMICLLYGSVLL